MQIKGQEILKTGNVKPEVEYFQEDECKRTR